MKMQRRAHTRARLMHFLWLAGYVARPMPSIRNTRDTPLHAYGTHLLPCRPQLVQKELQSRNLLVETSTARLFRSSIRTRQMCASTPRFAPKTVAREQRSRSYLRKQVGGDGLCSPFFASHQISFRAVGQHGGTSHEHFLDLDVVQQQLLLQPPGLPRHVLQAKVEQLARERTSGTQTRRGG